jgi:hypothetical protein
MLDRILTSDEFYTPYEFIETHYHLDDANDNVIDPNAGQGAWLFSYLQYKIHNGVSHEIALTQLYGVELQEDSTEICKNKLLMGREDLRHLVDKNIVCYDALKYHYRFDGTLPTESTANTIFNGTLEAPKKIKKPKIVDIPKELPSNLF